jgi:CheY-like chemotaxis protein
MKRNILLVEDEEILRMIYREELEEGGYKVQAVSNGQEALDSFRHGKFGLVVMDILMPVMDGLETLSFLKREYGKVPVILHTSQDKYLEDPRVLLADAVVRKGPDLEKLKKKIAELLKESSKKGTLARAWLA